MFCVSSSPIVGVFVLHFQLFYCWFWLCVSSFVLCVFLERFASEMAVYDVKPSWSLLRLLTDLESQGIYLVRECPGILLMVGEK